MAAFREAGGMLLHSLCHGFIDDTEFLLLYNLNTSHNPDFPYWHYEPFQFDNLSEAECMAEFRFYRNDVYLLAEVLQISEQVVCYNGTKLRHCVFF